MDAYEVRIPINESDIYPPERINGTRSLAAVCNGITPADSHWYDAAAAGWWTVEVDRKGVAWTYCLAGCPF